MQGTDGEILLPNGNVILFKFKDGDGSNSLFFDGNGLSQEWKLNYGLNQ